jgi:hypothetical protein
VQRQRRDEAAQPRAGDDDTRLVHAV